MAYVRKTDTLVSEILHKVREMSRTAQEPYSGKTLTDDSAEYQAIRNCIEDVSWKDAPQIKQQMPKDWLEGLQAKEIDVNIVAPERCPDSADISIYLKQPNDGYFTLSPAHASAGSSYYGNKGKIELREADFPPVLMAWFKGGKSNESLKKSIEDKIEHYVPTEYIEKLHAPSVPRSKTAQRPEKTTVEDLGIDRDALTSAAVAHQIASS